MLLNTHGQLGQSSSGRAPLISGQSDQHTNWTTQNHHSHSTRNLLLQRVSHSHEETRHVSVWAAVSSIGSSIQTLLAVLAVLAALLVGPTVAFNIDIERALVLKGDGDSMFGYAVAQHVDQSINWLLVGAPRAQTSQLNVIRGGAVFRCKTNVAEPCQEIPFDTEGEERRYSRQNNSYLPIEQKSDQWFGSTLTTSRENGVIVACAPRYMYFSINDLLEKREPIGTCFVSKASTTRYDKLRPCAQGLWGFGKQGFCQAGSSAALSHDGKNLLIGAPGSYFWQGQVFNYRAGNSGFEGLPLSSREGQAHDDDAYKGYSSTIGEFDGDSNDDYAVGIPKGDYYLGKVELYTQNLTVISTLLGEQFGAYFGYSLAVADLNGDRMDDVIVGAPMYAELEDDAFDTGRVYIFYQKSNVSENGKVQRSFLSQYRDTLDGQGRGSRFGMALTSLGDINYDGYDDLCVGAPYAGEDRRGAVYVYHGSKNGVITEVSQTIHAKDIAVSLSTFGISLSGGLDQDANYYPDLLIGAFQSDRAVFLRTKPVVRVYASLKLDPEVISLDSQKCALPDNSRVPCLIVHTCIEYSGVGVPDELALDISWVLDAKENNNSLQEQRAFYTNSADTFMDVKTHTLKKKETFCLSSDAYVKKNPIDKLSPIRVTMDFKLNQQALTLLNRQAVPPILDAYIPTSTSFTAHILKDCGFDNICIPDLAVQSVRVPQFHRLGSTTPIEVNIIVFNRGEDSFNTNLWIDLPPGVTYSTISNERSVAAISCDTQKHIANHVLCDLGNPMSKYSQSEFTLVLTPTNTNDTGENLFFSMYANSTNPDRADSFDNNYAEFKIPVIVEEPNIILYGIATPSLVVLNTTEEKEETGRRIQHVFQLKNQGNIATNQTELQIKWPGRDKQGNPVLVIDRELTIKGIGQCKIIILTRENATGYVGLGNLGEPTEVLEEGARKKRDTSRSTVSCSDRYCTIIQCKIGFMAPADNFILTVESYLVVKSLIQRREATEQHQILAVAFAQVKSIPYGLVSVDTSKFRVRVHEVSTNISTELYKPAGKELPIWVIVVSVLAGLLLLLLVILLFWFCGFFKRKKPVEEGYFVVNGKSVDSAADE